MSDPVFAVAPAKINLSLHVTGHRPDGFHDLESLVVFAAIADRLVAVPAQSDNLLVDGEFSGLIRPDKTNLVLRALAAFRSRWPDAVATGVAIRLSKNLPVAAGIGGGSADAAAMLRLLAQMAATPIDPAALEQIALELGADVPVCLLMQPAIMGGVGEKLARVAKLPPVHMVLANPGVAIGTREIFAALARRKNPPMAKLPSRFESARSLAGWLATTRNDLAGPASELVPQIKQITGFFNDDEHCLFARMSGSGATVFALYQTENDALAAATALHQRWPQYWVKATTIKGSNQ